jgi:hypothetical protein
VYVGIMSEEQAAEAPVVEDAGPADEAPAVEEPAELAPISLNSRSVS